jgi:CheY-like chemotaxis protein
MMPSILVVDDEQQIRQLIRETLEQAGYHVTEARDGKEVL